MAENDGAAAAAGILHMRAPPFDSSDLERYFGRRKYKNKLDQLDILWSLLTPAHLDRVGAAWRDVDPEEQYDRLKRDLIATYGLTKRQKVQKLLNMPLLGDELPLTRLFKMQALLPDKERKSELLYGLFIRMLPKSLVDKLHHVDDLDVVGYATAADSIVRNSQSSPDDFSGVCPISYNLRGAVSEPARGASSKVHPQGDLNPDGLCRIHARYGNKARKCVAVACKMHNVPRAQKPHPGNANANH
ncbi:Tick transposon [Caligus rogercresseyi]|uniref:Tick transposon n=1 Tax=Caligus rogercresseyi TaxID=217165 RepID=A0A7T8JWS9_CALRO|nr:Tick transposon [Caligus rogercresseyi]